MPRAIFDPKPRDEAIALDEFELIGQYFKPLATAPEALGLADDAAVLAPLPGLEWVVTTDALIEGQHFLPGDPPGSLARKLLRVNLSDLAAKGATPRAYLLVLQAAGAPSEAWLEAFCAGLAADQSTFGVSLLGGDTVLTSGPLSLVVTAFGDLAAGSMIRRQGAAPGEVVWVTGTIGDGFLGLKALTEPGAWGGAGEMAALIARYRHPEPRTYFGRHLPGLATAALDVSDGLLADAGHLARASGVGIAIRASAVPVSPSAQRALDASAWTLIDLCTGGDDYEILFTAPPSATAEIERLAKVTGTDVTAIGTVSEGSQARLVDASGKPIHVASPGYQHFR
ncbi:MAG: thiamine-phosphate kinase [Pseudomonadota bacterium]